MKKVFGIVGWSGSGKTDLICRIIQSFKRKNICVASLKHSHHNFEVDKEGKDSFNHLRSGSNEVIIYNEKKFAMISSIKKKKITLANILKKFSSENQIILIEGMKKNKIPKIEVIRSSLKKPYLFIDDTSVKAIVFDNEDKKSPKTNLPKFNFSETEKISSFILKYFKNG